MLSSGYFLVTFIGNVLANGVMLNHKGSDQQLHELRLVALEGGGKRQAMLWVAAMQKVSHCLE